MPTPIALGQFTIVDLNDGVSSYSIILSPESILVPSNFDGSGAVLTNASTTVSLLKGTTPVVPTLGSLVVSNCTATKNDTTKVVSITSTTADTGYVDIPVYDGATLIATKRVLFSKAKQGIQGVGGATGATGVSFRNKGAWSAVTPYVNDSQYTDIVTLNGSSYSCKVSNTNQTPPNATYWDVVSLQGAQGPIGPTGNPGADSYSMVLSTESVTIPTDSAGANPVLTGAFADVYLYLGSNSIAPTLGTLVVNGCTATKSGTRVTITGATADSGYVDIPISDGAKSIGTKRLNFSKSKQGNSSIILTLEIPDGNIFQGNVGNPKTVDVKLRKGETDITSSATTQWYFNGVENTNLANLKTLEVYPADVDGALTIKVVATYNSIQYQDSIIFTDLDDVYQVSISGKDKIKNSSENVVLTAIVFRGSSQITDGFRCRWTNIGTTPATVIYEGINTTGTLVERGVQITLTPSQINDKLDLLCELSVDTVEQQLDTTEQQYIPSYDSKAYAAAMSVALS